MAVGDIYQARILTYSTPLSQIGLNTVYFQTITSVGLPNTPTANQQALAAALDSIIAPLYKPFVSVNSNYRGVQVKMVSALPIPSPSAYVLSDGPGTGAGNQLPAQDSGLISIATGLAGASYRGRVYIPFPGTASNGADGQITAAATVVLQAIATALVTPFSFTTAGHSTETVALSVRRWQNRPTKPPVYAYIRATSAIGINRWATQRRRGQFGRINPLPF